MWSKREGIRRCDWPAQMHQPIIALESSQSAYTSRSYQELHLLDFHIGQITYRFFDLSITFYGNKHFAWESKSIFLNGDVLHFYCEILKALTVQSWRNVIIEVSYIHIHISFLASKTKKNPSKFLATRKRHDRIEEILKSDGLGSKRWLFYPRSKNKSEPAIEATAKTSDNIDQRVKVGISGNLT